MRRGRVFLAMAVTTAVLLHGLGGARAEDEPEYMRLRPLKEPACTETHGKRKCPLVAAPRVNKRRSTIPGIQHPDHGRPPVISTDPLGRLAPPRRIFGNRGIIGD